MSSSAESEPVVTEVERFAIRKFAASLGETDPIFFDVDAARAAGYRDLLAPPTFAGTLSTGPIPGVELPPAGNLHGGQEFELSRPMVAGDQISVVRRLIDTKERDGRTGKLTLYTFENEGRLLDGELVFTSRQVIIVRTVAETVS